MGVQLQCNTSPVLEALNYFTNFPFFRLHRKHFIIAFFQPVCATLVSINMHYSLKCLFVQLHFFSVGFKMDYVVTGVM